jgi:phosphatidylinositol alpha-1,6-mannosyltransferase
LSAADRSATHRDLVLVTAGLELEGGGRATLGRLLAAAAAAHARERGLAFEVLSLGAASPLGEEPRVRFFRGSRAGLARAIVARQLRRPRPALLYDLLGPARTQALLPRALCGPYGIVLLGIEVWRPVSRARRRALARADLTLAISRHTLERARAALPRLVDGARVLHLALEERPPLGDRDEALLAGVGEGYLLIVGRMSTSEGYKGHDQLLAALPRLLEERPEARLVVVGDGDDRERLHALAASRGLGRAVAFTGFVSEATLRELYRRAAVFVLPSRGEGFGLVYLEAMRAALPCVAARGSAAEEIVVPEGTGLLVDPDDPAALAQALSRLLADPAAARRLGEAGRRRLDEAFAPDLFRQRLGVHLDRLTALPFWRTGQGPARLDDA